MTGKNDIPKQRRTNITCAQDNFEFEVKFHGNNDAQTDNRAV
jgi:hypothetical protein